MRTKAYYAVVSSAVLGIVAVVFGLTSGFLMMRAGLSSETWTIVLLASLSIFFAVTTAIVAASVAILATVAASEAERNVPPV